MKIIGIAGKKRSGKDETCRIVKDWYKKNHPNIPVYRIAFADALKLEVAKMYGLSVSYIEAHKENFRLILQGHGTDYRRKLARDTYWLEKYLKSCLAIKEQNAVVVTPDTRFLNEASLIKEFGGEVWIIKNIFTETNDSHASETELNESTFDFNQVISNSGTIQDLEQTIHNILNK